MKAKSVSMTKIMLLFNVNDVHWQTVCGFYGNKMKKFNSIAFII